MNERWAADDLRDLAATLLGRAGLDHDKALVVADVLVEGDLLGQTTHGLNLLPGYLDEVASGRMALTGEPTVVAETPTVQTWDGNWLPGPWLVRRACAHAAAQAGGGIAAVALRRSGHIGCLGAYLRPAAEAGKMLLIACSDPSGASVAPFGGTKRLYTPNPLAAGWPSPRGPVMIDVSMSITTNGMTARRHKEGVPFDHAVLMDATGRPTADPAAYFAEPGGSLLPLGGMEAGHKGFALGLLVEALTSALAGHGRAESPRQWGASVLVLMIDPERFGGHEAFLRETGWMARAVHDTPPIPGGPPPRLPRRAGADAAGRAAGARGGAAPVHSAGAGRPRRRRRVGNARTAVILRGARSNDRDSLDRLVRDAYRPYVARLGRAPAPMGYDHAALIADGVVTVAELDGAVAGMVALLPRADHLLLDTIAVAPACQGRGVGRALMAHADAEARRHGLAEVRLYTNVLMTENIATYLRAGYVETGRRDDQGFSRVFFSKRLP